LQAWEVKVGIIGTLEGSRLSCAAAAVDESDESDQSEDAQQPSVHL
jgi:hypothetical protein